jgi:hypothetical protein
MIWNYDSYVQSFLPGFLTTFLIPLMIWSIFWKGWALWRAAKNDSKPWFVALLIVNTLGILEILYIFVFGKKPLRKK